MNYYKFIILTFAVTALWDVVLRFMALNPQKVPNIINETMPFIKDLNPYFKEHTLLSAALIAGFVGATTQPLILKITPFPKSLFNFQYLAKFFLVTFVISALYGFVMKATKLFPRLDKYYYNKLGVVKSMYHDGISGLIVQITLLFLLSVRKI
tara:strand:+ start:336 stop:794 length:459 start_codon:yes stop_codon:yes gene_type:complete